jgi:hypothetical protein
MKQLDGRAVAQDNELRILRGLNRFGWLRTRDLAALVFTRWAGKPVQNPSLVPPTATASALRMAQRTLRRMLDARLVLQAGGPDGGPSSFRVEPNSQNGRSSSSPVGLWAGCL